MEWEFKPHNNKKCVYVVRVDNYWPELCDMSLPNLQIYANKIGADFHVITERKYPEFPPTYEKMQVYDLGMDNEWNILIDADFLIHPLCPDFTKQLRDDTVGIDYAYDASLLFDMNNKYFRRDGRYQGMVTNDNRQQGIATGLVVTNNLTHDLWTPLECSWEEVLKRTKRAFIVDEYCVSMNLARYGLKYRGIFQDHLHLRDQWLIHLGAEEKSQSEKDDILKRAETLLESWGHL